MAGLAPGSSICVVLKILADGDGPLLASVIVGLLEPSELLKARGESSLIAVL